MGMTLVEKITAARTGKQTVEPGEILFVNVDHVMIHDLFAPFVIEKFRDMGFERVWDPDKIALIYDHLVPASFVEDSRHHRVADAFAADQGIGKVHRSDGVCHQLMPEMGYARPGEIVFGTDSHTTTYGAIGTFATGIGYTEMAAILGTGSIWIKVPRTLRLDIRGALAPGVCSKDVILRIIGDIGADRATYRAMEFGGPAIEAMSVASRMTIANMAVEAGAKVGIMAPDEKTRAFCTLPADAFDPVRPDADAVYERVYQYDAGQIKPVVACPSNVDRVEEVERLAGTRIDQAFLGSCTNGRLEDLAAAAAILKGRKVSPYVRFIVTPASRRVYAEAVKAGVIGTLIEAGAIVTHPACGLCCGRSGGIVADGERVIATNNRNFLGRMGHPGSEVFLASPATVAASALEGRIADPRAYM